MPALINHCFLWHLHLGLFLWWSMQKKKKKCYSEIVLNICLPKMWIQWKLQIWLSLVLRYQPSFHGVDLSALRGAAVDEYFRQPIVVRHPLPTNNFTPTIYSVEMCNWNERLVWGRAVNQGEVLPSECGAEKRLRWYWVWLTFVVVCFIWWAAISFCRTHLISAFWWPSRSNTQSTS